MHRPSAKERLIEIARRGHRHASTAGFKTYGTRAAVRVFAEIEELARQPRVLASGDFHLVLAKCKFLRRRARAMTKGDAINLNRNIRDLEKLCQESVQLKLPGFSEATR